MNGSRKRARGRKLQRQHVVNPSLGQQWPVEAVPGFASVLQKLLLFQGKKGVCQESRKRAGRKPPWGLYPVQNSSSGCLLWASPSLSRCDYMFCGGGTAFPDCFAGVAPCPNS